MKPWCIRSRSLAKHIGIGLHLRGISFFVDLEAVLA